MRFLIDENLPVSVGSVFEGLGFQVQHVRDIKGLHGRPDEVIFDYAVSQKSIVVTRDLNFANPIRFELHRLPGIVVLRFPNDISIKVMVTEIKNLISAFKNNDWHNIIILQPGSARLRQIDKKSGA